MSNTSKFLVIGGVSVASGVLLAAWLLTGTRKEKTKKFISKGKASIAKSFNKETVLNDDSEVHYYI